jgi:hypothetical protein
VLRRAKPRANPGAIASVLANAQRVGQAPVGQAAPKMVSAASGGGGMGGMGLHDLGTMSLPPQSGGDTSMRDRLRAAMGNSMHSLPTHGHGLPNGHSLPTHGLPNGLPQHALSDGHVSHHQAVFDMQGTQQALSSLLLDSAAHGQPAPPQGLNRTTSLGDGSAASMLAVLSGAAGSASQAQAQQALQQVQQAQVAQQQQAQQQAQAQARSQSQPDSPTNEELPQLCVKLSQPEGSTVVSLMHSLYAMSGAQLLLGPSPLGETPLGFELRATGTAQQVASLQQLLLSVLGRTV